MPSQEFQRKDDESDDSLELNKETLQDLDLDPRQQENIKAGGLMTTVVDTVVKTIGDGLTTVARTG